MDTFYKDLVDSINDYAIFRLDSQGYIKSWNPGAQRIKGYQEQEIIGKHFSIFYPEDQRQSKPPRELEIARAKGKFQEEGWRIKKDGSRFWAHVTITPILDGETVVGFSKVTKDLTHSYNEKLKMDETLDLTLSVSKVGHWYWDLKTGSLFWSDRLREIFDVPEDIVIKVIDDFSPYVHPDDTEKVNAAIKDSIEQGVLYNIQYRIIHQDQSIHWVHARGRVILDESTGDSNVFIGIVTNIDQEKQHQLKLEDELSRAQINLIQKAKMSALGEMAGGIAHEINTPLATIVLYSQLIDRISGQNEQIQKQTKHIADTAKKIGSIIKGLRSFARDGDQDPMVEVSIVELVNNTLDLCRNKFKSHGVDLTLNDQSQNSKVLCRPVQIEQVLLNLLNNAHDAIEALENKWIKIKIEVDGEYASIIIIDSGKGVPEENLGKIMQPFFTTKEIGKGTGLGLSISKGIMESHKGSLSYRFTDASQFILTLPVSINQGKQ